MMVLGKKIQKSSTKTNVRFAILFLVALLCLLTTIGGARSAASYGEYLKHAFSAGRQGLSSAVAGGWLFSLITYPFVKIIKYVGAIIFFSLLTVLVTVLYVLKRKKSAVKTEGVRAYPGKLPEEDNGVSGARAEKESSNSFAGANGGGANGVLAQSGYNQSAYNQGGYNYNPFEKQARNGAGENGNGQAAYGGQNPQNYGGLNGRNDYNSQGYDDVGFSARAGGYNQNANAYGGNYNRSAYESQNGYAPLKSDNRARL